MMYGQRGIMMADEEMPAVAEDGASGSPIQSVKIIPVFRRKMCESSFMGSFESTILHQEFNNFSGHAIFHSLQSIKVSRLCRCQR